MEKLFTFQEEMLEQVSDKFYRSLYHQLDWEQRMFGITGLRGTGKTTMLLQFLKYSVEDREKALYVTADHSWFYENTLLDLAHQFHKYGGNLLLIDEIHKYPRWSRELKNIYDGLPKMQVIFTASSVLDILKGEADLSRRALTYELPGLSFREYLQLVHQKKLPTISLEKALLEQQQFTRSITDSIKPLPLFKEYMQSGYFPFIAIEKRISFHQKLNQVINTVLEVDLQIVEGFSRANMRKLKQLLGVIAESAPFEPNISKLAGKLHMGRDTIKLYLEFLQRARLLNLLSKDAKGIASLQKPDKVYLENTNLSYALKNQPEIGTLRETFLINQLYNAGHTIHLADHGDFLINNHYTVEVGGPNKNDDQIRNSKNGYLVLDDIEHPFLNRVPLWVFGFMY